VKNPDKAMRVTKKEILSISVFGILGKDSGEYGG
jgi:hypothetical protein